MEKINDKIFELIIILKELGVIKFRQDFADEIGVCKQTFVKIKNKKQNFTVEHLTIIIEKYNVNPNWLFGFETNTFIKKKVRQSADNTVV